MRSVSKDRNVQILRAILPFMVGIVIALVQPPAGLTYNAWYYFALFAAVITGAITEPIPVAAVAFTGISIAAVTGLVFSAPSQSIGWALSGFSNTTVWLIFAGFMFATGYFKTGLGKRVALLLIKRLGKRTIGLVMLLQLPI
jgi:L-tartrate/succinate antiporter